MDDQDIRTHTARRMLIGGLLLFTCTANGQFAPPFVFPHLHPDLSAPVTPEEPVDIVLGLEFVSVSGPNGQTWKGYYADRLICLTAGPGLRLGTNDHIEWDWPSNPGFQKFSNPGDPPPGHPPPHAGDTCKWIAAWSNNLNTNPIKDLSFTVNVTLFYDPPFNGQTQVNYQVPIRVRFVGGPLSIGSDAKADDLAFIKHRADVPSSDGDDELVSTPDAAFPWYATDFDYNPFDYRDKPNYKLDRLQRVNRFKSRPYWQQPIGITVEHTVSTPGTFLNQNADLAVLAGGGADPQKTSRLPWSTYVLIAMDGDVDSSVDYVTAASYWCDVGGVPTLVATDQSNLYFEYADERDGTPWRNGASYNKFRVHKPTEDLQDSSALIKPWSPPYPGMVGARFVYRLIDQYGHGMPGVWIQERFIGEWLPDSNAFRQGFQINEHRMKWTTQRAGYNNSKWMTGAVAADGLMGTSPDTIFDYPEDPPLNYVHEYWAATDKEADQLADYPWRTVPGSVPPFKKYLGIFVGSYDMFFGPSGVTHNERGRLSGEGPGN